MDYDPSNPFSRKPVEPDELPDVPRDDSVAEGVFNDDGDGGADSDAEAQDDEELVGVGEQGLPIPPTAMIRRQMAQITEVQQLTALAALSSEMLKESLQFLTPKQLAFLRVRASCSSDVEALHMAGRPRIIRNPGEEEAAMRAGMPPPMPMLSPRRCGCSRAELGWRDMREGTLLTWKHQERFMVAYRALLEQPMLYAASRLESIAPQAVDVIAKILDGSLPAKASEKLKAAVVVLEADGLKSVQGVNARHRPASQEQAEVGMAQKVLAERARREMSLPVGAEAEQKQLASAEDPARYLP